MGKKEVKDQHPFPCCGGSHEYPPEHTQDCSTRSGQREMKVIVYKYAGNVERCRTSGRFNWYKGYSENGNTYPWLTMTEAHADAKKRGARAVFA